MKSNICIDCNVFIHTSSVIWWTVTQVWKGWTFKTTFMTPFLRTYKLNWVTKQGGLSKCACVTTSFQVNVISGLLLLISLLALSPPSKQVRVQADRVFPMPGESVAIVLAFWRKRSCCWLTTPLIPLRFLYRRRRSLQFASPLLSCLSPCQERGKRRESRGSIKSKKRVFPLCAPAWQKANFQSESMTEEAACLFHYADYLRQRWKLNPHFLIPFLPVWARRDARLLPLIR